MPAEAARRIAAEPDASIGEAILDQRNVAGIGTVYRAEILFLRGVNPWTPVARVPDLDRLLELGRRLLMANRHRPGHVTTGDTRRGRANWVYGREGHPCWRCGTPVRRGMQGVGIPERVIYWCPSCQPEKISPP